MNLSAIYEFIAGNSRITPLGILIGVLVVSVIARSAYATWIPGLYLAILAATLAASVFEKEG
ncbi:MAG: hypothetical protein M3Z14_02625 [Candidatus Eremiobacteraeota bacterium]|nr:hypothetical protein [Candidatus Eremiobacteraeota bacterium]